jgi:hypothetical protein
VLSIKRLIYIGANATYSTTVPPMATVTTTTASKMSKFTVSMRHGVVLTKCSRMTPLMS